MGKQFFRLIGLGTLFFVAACAAAGPLQVTPSSVSVYQKKAISVAVVIPDSSRSVSMLTGIPSACFSPGNAPGEYGKLFVDTVKDRFSRLFEDVKIVRSADEAADADAIFEATLKSVSYKAGCLIAPEAGFRVEGGLKSVASNGTEIWRSNTVVNQFLFSGMTSTLVLGPDISRRISGLVEDWVNELQSMPVAKYAPGAAGQFAAGNDRPQTKSTSNDFPTRAIRVKFARGPEHPDDIAVIIGNADYSNGRDIPNVNPAYADAAGIRNYVKNVLGIKKDNIIFLKDASQARLTATFGSKGNFKGQLYNYVKPGISNVFVYYSGHGAPGGKDGDSYIVPTDAQASMIELNGYPLKTLYKNLSRIPAKSMTVVLEACFSGASQAGTVISNASPIYLKAKETGVPSNITLIAAGAANQVASWERDKSSGLFTEYFLKGMSGEADASPYGNGDGKVAYDELGRYLKKTLTYFARRYYGRDQTAQIVVGK